MFLSVHPDSTSFLQRIRLKYGLYPVILLLSIIVFFWGIPAFSGDLPLKHSPMYWMDKVPALPDNLSEAHHQCPIIEARGESVDAAIEELEKDTLAVDSDQMDGVQMMEMIMSGGDLGMIQGFGSVQQGLAKESLELIQKLQPHHLSLQETGNEFRKNLSKVGQGLPDCSLIEHVLTADECFVENDMKKKERRLQAVEGYLKDVQPPLEEMDSLLRPFLQKWDEKILMTMSGADGSGLGAMLMTTHRVELLNKVASHAVVPRKQVCGMIAGFEAEHD